MTLFEEEAQGGSSRSRFHLIDGFCDAPVEMHVLSERGVCVCVCVLRGVNPGIHKEPFGFAFIAFRFVASRGAYPRAAHVCCKRSGHSDMRISRADGECLVATCLSSVSRPGCLGVSLSVQ